MPPGIRIIPAGAKSGGKHEHYHLGEDPYPFSTRRAPQCGARVSLDFGTRVSLDFGTRVSLDFGTRVSLDFGARGHPGDLGRRAAGALRRAGVRGQARAAPAEHHLGRQPEVAMECRVMEDSLPLPLRSGGLFLVSSL